LAAFTFRPGAIECIRWRKQHAALQALEPVLAAARGTERVQALVLRGGLLVRAVSEALALTNAGLALIGLQRTDDGSDLVGQARLLEECAGGLPAMADMQRELGLALEQAGRLPEAWAAYTEHRRLAEMVRGDDVLARWGGGAFLVWLPGVDADHAQALAQRVLQAVGGVPVTLPGAGSMALRVTASIGYGCIPLPPARVPLSLERAINLADMALYTAKNQGRNCAVRIHEARTPDVDALRVLETDFDQARRDGRVVLERLAGPVAPAAVAGPPLQPA